MPKNLDKEFHIVICPICKKEYDVLEGEAECIECNAVYDILEDVWRFKGKEVEEVKPEEIESPKKIESKEESFPFQNLIKKIFG